MYNYLNHRPRQNILYAKKFQNLAVRGEKVDAIDIVITYKNGDRKLVQSITILNGYLTRE